MSLIGDLKQNGYALAGVRKCQTCFGTGKAQTYSAVNIAALPFTGAFTSGTSAASAADCHDCIRGFQFGFMETSQLMAKLFDDLIGYLEDPNNVAARTRFLNLYLTDIEIKLGARTNAAK
jgi:hypothetical protein